MRGNPPSYCLDRTSCSIYAMYSKTWHQGIHQYPREGVATRQVSLHHRSQRRCRHKAGVPSSQVPEKVSPQGRCPFPEKVSPQGRCPFITGPREGVATRQVSLHHRSQRRCRHKAGVPSSQVPEKVSPQVRCPFITGPREGVPTSQVSLHHRFYSLTYKGRWDLDQKASFHRSVPRTQVLS